MSLHGIVLVRHGQASFGADDYDRLSPLGEEQSRRLGAWLKEAGIVPGAIAIGPRLRHRQTAEHCLQAAGLDLPLRTLAGLDEVDHVELLSRLRPDLRGADDLRAELRREADPQRAFQRIFEAAIARWTSGESDADYSVTWPQFRENARQALDQLAAHDDSPVWAFTSGGPIGVLAGAATGMPVERGFDLSWQLVNTGLTRIRPGKRGPALLSYNGWPHLEHHEHQRLITLR